ncbi:unnamed protein product, partial [Staurois parvus]
FKPFSGICWIHYIAKSIGPCPPNHVIIGVIPSIFVIQVFQSPPYPCDSGVPIPAPYQVIQVLQSPPYHVIQVFQSPPYHVIQVLPSPPYHAIQVFQSPPYHVIQVFQSPPWTHIQCACRLFQWVALRSSVTPSARTTAPIPSQHLYERVTKRTAVTS